MDVQPMNPHPGKWLMLLGGLLFVIGMVWWLLARYVVPGRLPGDIIIRRDGFTLYFPLATSLLLSVLISLVFWLLSRWK